MANINVFALRSDRISDWESVNPVVRPGEIVIANNDTSGDPEQLRIGKKDPGSPTTATAFNSLPEWYLLSQADRDKLTDLPAAVTGDLVLELLNVRLGTDVEAILNEHGLTAPAIAAAFDVLYGGDSWRRAYAHSIYGAEMDGNGDLTIPAGALALSDIAGLVSALAGKAASSHGHVVDEVSGLSAALAAKIDTSRIAVDLATLGEDGKLTASQVPSSVSSPVTSVLGRTGVVVATAGDYSASLITNTPAGSIAATTVQAAINELDTEKVAAALLGAAAGIPLMDSGSKILATYLPTVATTATWRSSYSWLSANTTMTSLPGTGSYQEFGGVSIRAYVNTTTCTDVFIASNVGTTGENGSKLVVEYSTDGGTNFTAIPAADYPLDAAAGTGPRRGPIASLPGGAIGTEIVFRIRAGNGGTGAGTVAMRATYLGFLHSVNLGPGVQNATQIAALLDPAYPGWRDPAGTIPDATLALAKIVNFATQTAPLRKAGTTGPLEVGTQADWRTFLDVANTVHGRKGTVVAANGDYTADQITPTATRVFVTPTQVELLDRGANSEKVSTSQVIGYFAPFIEFNGTGTTVITGTLTNALRCQWATMYNWRTVGVTIVPEAPCTMQDANGGTITSYTIQPNKQACVRRNGNIYRVVE